MDLYNDKPEKVTIVEKTKFEGLHWESNPHFKTGKDNRIVLPSENGSFTTIVWHGENPSESEYPHYALHFGGDDRLTFINGKNIIGDFVDCREGSKTLHQNIRLKWNGSPERRLVVPAGIAHWFKNLSGVVTRNEPVLRWDPEPDPLFSMGVDIYNISPKKGGTKFPVIKPHRHLLPLVFHHPFSVKQRKWAKEIKYFPTRVQVGNSIYLVVPKEKKGPKRADIKKLPLAPT